jgi:phage regulatory protein, rha family
MTNLISTPNVSLVNGQPATTSLAIAEHFGKRHDNVVRDIRRIMAETPDDFTALNFEESDFTDATGRALPMFIVFFDGFILLAMGYTGKKALQIKLAYIAAFNAMREQIETQPTPPLLDTTTRLSQRSDPERKELTAMVNAWVNSSPIGYAAARSVINAHFDVKSVDSLTVAQVKEAIAFVREKMDEAPKPLPTSPQAALENPGSNRLNELYFDIRRHIRNIEDNMTEIQGIVDRASMPRRGWGAFHHALVGNNQEAGRKAITSMICMLDGVYANVRSTMIACGM